MCTGSRFLCKIHLLFKYFSKTLCDFFTTLLVQMISVRQAVGILHCDRTVVVVDKDTPFLRQASTSQLR